MRCEWRRFEIIGEDGSVAYESWVRVGIITPEDEEDDAALERGEIPPSHVRMEAARKEADRRFRRDRILHGKERAKSLGMFGKPLIAFFAFPVLAAFALVTPAIVGFLAYILLHPWAGYAVWVFAGVAFVAWAFAALVIFADN